MPVFGKALVRPEVIDGGSYIHLMELWSLNVQHSIHKSKVTPDTYFDSFYFISCSNVHNCAQIKIQNQFLFCIHKQLNNNS